MSIITFFLLKYNFMGVVLRVFKTKQPFLLFFLPIIAVAFWLKWFINPIVNWNEENLMPLSSLLVNSLENIPIVIGIVSVFFVLLTSYGLFFINERYQVLRKGSNLPSLLYLLLVSALSSCIGFNPVIFASFFMLVAIERILYAYKYHKSISCIFDAGFAIGVSIGFYLYSGVFIIFALLAMILIGRFTIRDFIALFLGIIMPMLFIWVYYFYIDDTILLISKIHYNIDEGLNFVDFSVYQWIFIVFVGILYMLGLIGMFIRNTLNEIFDIKFFTILLWLTLFGILVPLLFFPKGVEIVFIINIAVSFFVSKYFVIQRHKWLGDFVLLLFFGIVILLQFPVF